MPDRNTVLGLVRAGRSYEQIAAELGIPAGQAFMIATGIPADGGDTLTAEDADRPGMLPSSTQYLVNPQAENPTKKPHVLEWIKQRAAQDTPMREAASQRTAEPGEIKDPDDVHEVTVVLTRQHNQVNALLEQLKTIPGHIKGGSPAQLSSRKSIVDMMTVKLSQHESVEEEFLWPTVRSTLSDGDSRADQALEQEQEGKNVLTALGKLDPDTEEFDKLVEQLDHALRKHVAFEERVFLALKATMSEQDRNDLGEKMLGAKENAPTRPHPRAPKKGGAVKAAGTAAAAVDKARDAAGSRPAQRKGKPEAGAAEETPGPEGESSE